MTLYILNSKNQNIFAKKRFKNSKIINKISFYLIKLSSIYINIF